MLNQPYCAGKLITLVLLLFGALSCSAARHYQAPLHQSVWKMAKTKGSCRLQHDIPYYGRAEFSHTSKKSIVFKMYAWRKNTKYQKVQLSASPTTWKHGTDEKKLGEVRYNKGNIPFSFRRSTALQLLAELEQGMDPSLTFVDKPGPMDKVRVSLSVVNFLPAYERFQSCVSRLSPMGFDKIKTRTVRFDNAKHTIKSEEYDYLNDVAEYVIRNSHIREIHIDGHTDYNGSDKYNVRLSRRRARALRRYLIKLKVPAKMIKIRYFGEKQPVSNNQTANGRTKNRRAGIQLIRMSE